MLKQLFFKFLVIYCSLNLVFTSFAPFIYFAKPVLAQENCEEESCSPDDEQQSDVTCPDEQIYKEESNNTCTRKYYEKEDNNCIEKFETVELEKCGITCPDESFEEKEGDCIHTHFEDTGFKCEEKEEEADKSKCGIEDETKPAETQDPQENQEDQQENQDQTSGAGDETKEDEQEGGQTQDSENDNDQNKENEQQEDQQEEKQDDSGNFLDNILGSGDEEEQDSFCPKCEASLMTDYNITGSGSNTQKEDESKSDGFQDKREDEAESDSTAPAPTESPADQPAVEQIRQNLEAGMKQAEEEIKNILTQYADAYDSNALLNSNNIVENLRSTFENIIPKDASDSDVLQMARNLLGYFGLGDTIKLGETEKESIKTKVGEYIYNKYIENYDVPLDLIKGTKLNLAKNWKNQVNTIPQNTSDDDVLDIAGFALGRLSIKLQIEPDKPLLSIGAPQAANPKDETASESVEDKLKKALSDYSEDNNLVGLVYGTKKEIADYWRSAFGNIIPKNATDDEVIELGTKALSVLGLNMRITDSGVGIEATAQVSSSDSQQQFGYNYYTQYRTEEEANSGNITWESVLNVVSFGQYEDNKKKRKEIIAAIRVLSQLRGQAGINIKDPYAYMLANYNDAYEQMNAFVVNAGLTARYAKEEILEDEKNYPDSILEEQNPQRLEARNVYKEEFNEFVDQVDELNREMLTATAVGSMSSAGRVGVASKASKAAKGSREAGVAERFWNFITGKSEPIVNLISRVANAGTVKELKEIVAGIEKIETITSPGVSKVYRGSDVAQKMSQLEAEIRAGRLANTDEALAGKGLTNGGDLKIRTKFRELMDKELKEETAQKAAAKEAAQRAVPQGVNQIVRNTIKISEGNVVVIGREAGSDIVVAGQTISRRHALLSIENGSAFIQDVSSNGTWITRNGRTFKVGKELLEDGDVITLGDGVEFLYQNEKLYEKGKAIVEMMIKTVISGVSLSKNSLKKLQNFYPFGDSYRNLLQLLEESQELRNLFKTVSTRDPKRLLLEPLENANLAADLNKGKIIKNASIIIDLIRDLEWYIVKASQKVLLDGRPLSSEALKRNEELLKVLLKLKKLIDGDIGYRNSNNTYIFALSINKFVASVFNLLLPKAYAAEINTNQSKTIEISEIELMAKKEMIKNELKAKGKVDSDFIKKVFQEEIVKPFMDVIKDGYLFFTGKAGQAEGMVKKGSYFVKPEFMQDLDISVPSVVNIKDNAVIIPIAVKSGSGIVRISTGLKAIETKEKSSGQKVKATIAIFEDLNNNGLFDTKENILPRAGVKIKLEKVNKENKITLHAGWNLITLPALPEKTITASNLLKEISAQKGKATAVSLLDNGAWKTYVLRDGKEFSAPFEDFALAPGKAYFVKSLKDSEFVFKGKDFDLPVKIKLSQGFNAVGFPNTLREYNASTLIDKVNKKAKATLISEFDFGLWNTFVRLNESFGDNFRIRSNSGYILKLDKDVEFIP